MFTIRHFAMWGALYLMTVSVYSYSAASILVVNQEGNSEKLSNQCDCDKIHSSAHVFEKMLNHLVITAVVTWESTCTLCFESEVTPTSVTCEETRTESGLGGCI